MISKNRKSSKNLAAHFNIISVFFIILIIAVMSVVSAALIYRVADNASRDYVRFYTMETVDVLASHLNSEIYLVQYASESNEIIEWFADEENQDKKLAAYNKMMYFAGIQQINGLYFAISESGNEYSIERGASYEEFIPYNVLKPDVLYDRWFFDALDSGYDFILKLDTVKSLDDYFIWIDHKVKHNGKVVGVFSSGLPFNPVFQDLFGEYDSRNVLGFIIDDKGLIQMDSTVPEANRILGSDSVYDPDEMRHILDVKSDAGFASVINSYLVNSAFFFNKRIKPEVYLLTDEYYRYMSIASVPNTNWITVTLYNSNALFNTRNLTPPIIVIAAAFIFYIFLSSFLLHRLVFKPLKLLTVSVSESDHDSNNIYGIKRDDEIGALARETQDAWIRLNDNSTKLKTSMEDRERQTRILNAVNEMAAALFSAEDETAFEALMPKGLKLMADCMDLDRIFIWRNDDKDGTLRLLYDWMSETLHCESPVRSGVNLVYKKDAPSWYEKFIKDDYVFGVVSGMSGAEAELMTSNGVKTILAIPVHLHGQFWGFVSFDNCRAEREMSREDINILRSGSLIMASAVNRNLQITALKEVHEYAIAANRSKSVFLANMSHEIRTPMNSIVGFSELALDDNISFKTRDYLNKILENSEWLLQIVNDILDISKIESGKMSLENIPFNLHELFSSCRTLIMPKAVEKGLSLHFYAEPSLGKRLYGDPTRLRQVLINLLSNAVKFTNIGLIKMQASVKSVDTKSVSMLFEIKDSGIGIPHDQIEKIFDPFMQAETGTTRKFGGSGLGLPIARNIIRMMGDDIHVESTPGVGSKFSFNVTFDAADMDGDNALFNKIVFDENEKPVFEGEILLCEDNVMNQQVICEHLARVGLKTEIAGNGRQGVEMVKSRADKGDKQYDLIFMDIHMPVMDGLEAASMIFEFDEKIPIVAMTANIMYNDREIYISRGMNDCIGKPFTSQELWRCLMKYFKPVTWRKDNAALRWQTDMELHQKLINNFVKCNNGIINEINNALKTDEIALAHRLVHTLKSNAGQLKKIFLQNAAIEVESRLKNERNNVTPQQLENLETELNKVLEELTPLVREPEYNIAAELMNEEEAVKTLDKLQILLDDSNVECLSFIGSLQMIPGSGELIQQIENFDFKPALITLAGLKRKVFGDKYG